MRSIITALTACLTLLGGVAYRETTHREPDITVCRGTEQLEVRAGHARIIDLCTGATRAVPLDQVLIDTENGPMAVLGDEAIPLTPGSDRECKRARPRGRDANPILNGGRGD